MEIKHPTYSQLSALRTLWKEAFGDSDVFLNAFFSTAFSPERCLVVSTNSEIVAALYWFDCIYTDKPWAYLYAVATKKALRGQGICHALIHDTHQHLKSLGYEGVLLVPGSTGLFHFYERLGYNTCCYRSELICSAAKPASPIVIKQIPKETYATLRRIYLPQGVVIQESHHLDFLETQASFYSGDGFLLAARHDETMLHGLELLGNNSLAPAILHFLGYSKGVFRLPGNAIPVAMYHSLTDSNTPAPTYFGFPFD